MLRRFELDLMVARIVDSFCGMCVVHRKVGGAWVSGYYWYVPKDRLDEKGKLKVRKP